MQNNEDDGDWNFNQPLLPPPSLPLFENLGQSPPRSQPVFQMEQSPSDQPLYSIVQSPRYQPLFQAVPPPGPLPRFRTPRVSLFQNVPPRPQPMCPFQTPGSSGYQTPAQNQHRPNPLNFQTPGQPSVSVTTREDRSELCETPVSRPNPSRRRNTPASASSRTSGLSVGNSISAYSTTTVEPLDRHTLLAVVEGRGQARGEIGIACMNLHTPNLVLCQFTDTQSYLKVISKVNIFRPYEILMPAVSCDTSNPSHLYVQLKKEVSNVTVVPIQRRIFNEAKGLQKLTSLAAEEFTAVVHSITNKYYCLSACAALLKYVELVQSMVFSSKSLRVEFQGSDQTCMIDHVTAQHLELLVNNRNPVSGHSVFGIVNDCRTPLGARILRMNILQPPCDAKLIDTRLNSIEELIKEREVLYGLQDILSRLPIDVEHVIASLIQIPKLDNVKITEQRINYVIALKHTLELLPGIVKLFEVTADEQFLILRNNLMAPEFETMLDTIKGTIQEEAQFHKGSVNMKRQRCFAVKADVNPILDVARQAYCEIVEDIQNYVVELSRQLNMTLRLGTNNQRGFYIQYIASARSLDVANLPGNFLQVRKRGNVVTFTTEMLISSDHRAQTVLKEIETLSGRIIAELITTIRSDIGTLFKVSEAIGYLDLVYSLANYALTTPRSIRPTFSNDVTSITMGRHPILDSIASEPAVPNNAFLSNDVNFKLITGPNMSGKTTYIKQVATLQVLAQIGSFVPAEAATFRITSNILSRIGTGDKIEENSSSFAVELNEMTYILQNAGDKSLIIIDELGRATSVEEGAAVSWSMAEELLKSKAYILFATHHMILTKLESLYHNVMNYSMETHEWQKGDDVAGGSAMDAASKLQYSHVIKRGVTDVENYGIKFAMGTSYPRRIIDKAMSVVKTVLEERGNGPALRDVTGVQKDRDKYLLGSNLRLFTSRVDINETDPSDLRDYFKGLQAEFSAMKGKQSENDKVNDAGAETPNSEDSS